MDQALGLGFRAIAISLMMVTCLKTTRERRLEPLTLIGPARYWAFAVMCERCHATSYSLKVIKSYHRASGGSGSTTPRLSRHNLRGMLGAFGYTGQPQTYTCEQSIPSCGDFSGLYYNAWAGRPLGGVFLKSPVHKEPLLERKHTRGLNTCVNRRKVY